MKHLAPRPLTPMLPLILVAMTLLAIPDAALFTAVTSGIDQNAFRQQAEDRPPKRAKEGLRTPYEIAAFLADHPGADLKSLWNQLGIKRVNFGHDSISEEMQSDREDSFLGKCNNCEVETYASDLDREPGKEVLVRIADRPTESCRYLVFKQSSGADNLGWRLIGHIDHGFGRYKMPEHSIEYGGGRSLLVIKVQEGSGTGYAVYYDRLFQVESSGIMEILSFPSEGHQSTQGYEPTQEFTTNVRKYETSGSGTLVELEFSVSYSAYSGSEGVQLWKKTQKAVYKTEARSKALVLDKNKSDLPQEDIDAIYGREGSLVDAFVRCNFVDLAKIASGPENSRKEWLRHYLTQAEESSQKEQLLKLLAQ